MDIESVRNYCLSLPMTTEDSAFGDDIVLFRVLDKIFCCLPLEGDGYLAVKCEPLRAIELRERYAEIEGAYHWNKKYWNQINLFGNLDDDFIRSQIRHSYSEVVKKLTKRIRTENPAITEIY
ncbi:MAG: MmcQ/YjbR family DNA-binding protein [Duncaniella sp.]|nr:MmcQ/YjbR family DNA-binding protein [Duncaniella sp.]